MSFRVILKRISFHVKREFHTFLLYLCTKSNLPIKYHTLAESSDKHYDQTAKDLIVVIDIQEKIHAAS